MEIESTWYRRRRGSGQTQTAPYCLTLHKQRAMPKNSSEIQFIQHFDDLKPKDVITVQICMNFRKSRIAAGAGNEKCHFGSKTSKSTLVILLM